MMTIRYAALVIGIIYVLVGILGFIPGLLEEAEVAEELAVDVLSGDLLGLFPVNILHTLVHLAVGVWGILAYRSLSSSRLFHRALAVIFGLLFIMGLIPLLRTTFGLIPLYSHDIWLHALTAAAGAYFGFVADTEAHEAEVRVS